MAVLRLVPTQGPATPLEINQDRVVVGREATCDVVVNDGSVSRKHALIERRGTGWAIVDQGSANGTFVDSQRVTDLVLHTGQQLRFGAMAYRVEIEGDEGATILTGIPEATVIQDSPVKRPPTGPPAPPPAPAVKPAPPPWAPPARGPVVTPAPLLATPAPPARPAGAPPPLPPRAAGGPPPLPPRAGGVPPPPPPLPPRTASSRPPAAAPPGSTGAPPPAKKARGPLFWVGGGCCGCLVLVLVFLGVIGGGAYFLTSAAVETVRAQIADVKKGDMAAAYGRMSEEYRAQHSMEEFVAFVDRHPSLKQNTDSTFMNRNVQNDTAHISGSLTGGAVTESVTYTLVKERGGWRISDINFDEATTVDQGGGSAPAAAAAPRGGAAPSGSGSLHLETLAAEKSAEPPGYVIAIKLRATGFGTTGPADAPRADLVLDLETRGPGGQVLTDLSRMELQQRDRPDGLSPPHVDFDVSVTLRDAKPGEYVARLTVRDQIGRDIKTQDVSFTLP
jgi:FHA domain-containing protein/uncharacterized protein DUF4864